METDYLSMCKNFYAATKIPVTLLKGKYAVYTSFNDITGTSPAYYREDLFPMSIINPTFCSDSPDIGYGRLLIENTDYNLILGPVFNVPVTEELIRYSSESGVSLENREQYRIALCNPPAWSGTVCQLSGISPSVLPTTRLSPQNGSFWKMTSSHWSALTNRRIKW